MKHIEKQDQNPDFLDTWLKRKEKQFEGKPPAYQWDRFQRSKEKKDLQRLLLQEQGHLCAYCNRLIHQGVPPEDDLQMRMDHLYAKSSAAQENRIFDYRNIVGSCYGGERDNPKEYLHCEGLKKSQDQDGNQLPEALFPTDPRCEAYKVTDQGTLLWKDESLQPVMEAFLNLNCKKLKNDRAGVLSQYVDLIDSAKNTAELEAEIRLTLSPDSEGRMEAYAGVIANFLKQYL